MCCRNVQYQHLCNWVVSKVSCLWISIVLYSSVIFSCKLSVAVCIGFFAAWSPYAVVSMWAAFGHIENIPPLAFALPAMFAKSSTIYNPIIYLMLRPNIRRMMRRDLGALCHTCLRGCLWSQGPAKCCSKPEIRVRLRSVHRHNNQFPSSNSSAQPPMAALKDHSCDKCKDAFECFRHYPQMCSIINPAINGDSSKDQGTPVPQTYKQKPQSVCHKKSLLAIMCAKRTSEIDNFHINLEMVPGHAKVAWPWYFSKFTMFTQYLWTYFADYVLSHVELLNLYFQEICFSNVPRSSFSIWAEAMYLIYPLSPTVLLVGTTDTNDRIDFRLNADTVCSP